jgi:hypothetical protein
MTAPSGGVGAPLSAPPGGAMRALVQHLATPPHGVLSRKAICRGQQAMCEALKAGACAMNKAVDFDFCGKGSTWPKAA